MINYSLAAVHCKSAHKELQLTYDAYDARMFLLLLTVRGDHLTSLYKSCLKT